MLSILAGMMIAIGGIINLTVGGIAGALFFSMGLLTILTLKFELFTGKAGLLVTNEIKPGKLFGIWLGNFIGTAAMAFLLVVTPKGLVLAEEASKIVAIRISYGPIVNLNYGIMCGMLKLIAVKPFAMSNSNPLYAMLPVAIFILCGFNHCIADMFYLNMGAINLGDYLVLIPTTIGNLIGCNIIPWAMDYSS